MPLLNDQSGPLPMPTQITICPGGPILVRGEITLLDAEGQQIPSNRAVIALCRCGKSAETPFCDGTHKLLRQHPVRQIN